MIITICIAIPIAPSLTRTLTIVTPSQVILSSLELELVSSIVETISQVHLTNE